MRLPRFRKAASWWLPAIESRTRTSISPTGASRSSAATPLRPRQGSAGRLSCSRSLRKRTAILEPRWRNRVTLPGPPLHTERRWSSIRRMCRQKRGSNASNAGGAGVDDPTAVAELENYIRDGKFTEVEPLLAAYVKQRPKSSWGWYALGYSQFAQKKIGDSIKALSRSLQLDIRQAEAHKILGRNLMIIGRFDAAQLEFEQAIRYKPRSAENHYNLGKLFSIQDNWEPARKALEAAVALDPDYVEAVDALGFALEALGDDAGAVSQYEKAIGLNDQKQGRFASPHVNLSAYYNRVGEADKALEHARKAIELDPTADRAWFQKARAEERRGDIQAAVDALNEAIVQNPRASSYYYVMAGLCRRLGLTEESRKALDIFKRLEQESAELDKKRRSSEMQPVESVNSPYRHRSSRRTFLQMLTGCAGSSLLAVPGTSKVFARSQARQPVRRASAAARCGSLMSRPLRGSSAPATFPAVPRTSSSCWRRWVAAPRFSITTTTAGSTSFLSTARASIQNCATRGRAATCFTTIATGHLPT